MGDSTDVRSWNVLAPIEADTSVSLVVGLYDDGDDEQAIVLRAKAAPKTSSEIFIGR